MTQEKWIIKRRPDGSIDYDAFQAEVARKRSRMRSHLVCKVIIPMLWNAPPKLLSMMIEIVAKLVKTYGRRGSIEASRASCIKATSQVRPRPTPPAAVLTPT